MPYGDWNEFPHGELQDGDAGHYELIKLYKDLLSKYTGTLDQITALSTRLDQYEAAMNKNISIFKQECLNAIDERVPQAVNTATADMTVRLSKLEQKQISDFNLLSAEQDSISDEVASVQEALDNDRANNAAKFANAKLYTDLEVSTAKQFAQNRVDDAIDILTEYTDDTAAAIRQEISQIQAASNYEAVKWIWENGIGANGFTAMEWYSFSSFTCADWNKSKITAIEWYTNGKFILGYNNWIDTFLSPFSGEWTTVKGAIFELAEMLRQGGITAEDYDNLRIPAGEYDSKNIQAFAYDYDGRRMLHE